MKTATLFLWGFIACAHGMNHVPDVNLVVKNDLNEEELFFVHSYALLESEYFNFRLKNSDSADPKRLLFRTNSGKLLNKFINFIYGHGIEIGSLDEFCEALCLQEQLRFAGKLNEQILNFLSIDRMEKMQADELARVLKNTCNGVSPAAQACSTKILDYIYGHQNTNKNCSLKILSKHLNPAIMSCVDRDSQAKNDALIQKMIEEEKSRIISKDQAKVEALSKKISKKIGEKRTMPVSSSIEITNEVMRNLKNTYNIESELVNDSNAGKFHIRIARTKKA